MKIQNLFIIKKWGKIKKLTFGVKIQIFSMLKNMSKIEFWRENSDSVQHDKYDKNLKNYFWRENSNCRNMKLFELY